MKRIARRSLSLAAILAVVAMVVAPAGAATGGGTVTGTVNLSPGLGAVPVIQQFNFQPIVLTGTFAQGAVSYEGQITTSVVTGRSSAPENLVQGTGVIDTFTFGKTGAGAGNITGSCGKPAPNNVGSAGTFVRVGAEVVVVLTCQGTITSATGATATFSNQTVRVVAQFTPTVGNGVTAPVTQANFSGSYELVA